ncbi:peptidase domain-containing ABC transporter [Rhizobium sp. BK068]|uniref:peptidase domain-containing ABC transporter n=2 Tax=Rhizobium TaxID=379 RepID=UPI0010F2836A|nr:subfamily B ATP-binding cassette protein HlyB/CyaB [Rhizobium sp. BK068]
MHRSQGLPAPLSWFFQSTFRYSPLMAELMLLAIAIRLLGIVQPFVFQAIIDRVLPFQREATLLLIVAILVATTIFVAILDIIVGYLSAFVANQLTAEFARRILNHVLNLRLSFLQRWQVGETLARIGEIDVVRAFLTTTVSGVVLDVLFALVYVGALLSISPLLTLIVVVALPLQAAGFAIFGPFIRKRMQDTFLAETVYQSRLVEVIGNLVTVKAMSSEAAHEDALHAALSDGLARRFDTTKLTLLSDALREVLSNGTVILIIFVGSTLVLNSTITLGELIAFHLLADKISGPILSLSTVWEHWLGLKVARYRLGDLLNHPAENADERPLLRLEGRPRIQLEAVSFAYTPEQPILSSYDLCITGDRPTLLVGPSGCGKSTLGKLICGLYQADAGTVLINRQELHDFDPASVRRKVTYMPQEPALFTGSIRENLLMADSSASEEDLISAIKSSGCERFVSSFPNGLEHQVGEGGRYLSGGQRQRLALARALIPKPAVLILDEPTSALDEASAQIIVETLNNLRSMMTLVIITHSPDLLGSDVTIIDLANAGQPPTEQT